MDGPFDPFPTSQSRLRTGVGSDKKEVTGQAAVDRRVWSRSFFVLESTQLNSIT